MASGALLMGCSPTHDWRTVQSGNLHALLPCKPDRATRALPLGGAEVSVDMIGCEAGGRTFALARIAAADPSTASALLAAWRGATLATWGVDATDTVPRTVFHPPGGSALPGGLRQRARGRQPTGAAVHADVAWFAYLPVGAPGSVYQALVLAAPGAPEPASPDEPADTFFAALRLGAP